MFWNELWQAAQPVLISAVVGLFGVLLTELAALAAEKLKAARDSVKSEIAQRAVQYVEQTLRGALSAEKYAAAAERAALLLKNKHIAVDAAELRTLIESAVNSFNSVYWRNMANTAPAAEPPVEASNGQLTEHVHIDDLKCGCGGKYCDGFGGMTLEEAARAAKPVTEIFERGYALIQERFPDKNGERQVKITSAIRCPTYNAKIGSKNGSYHIIGKALDVDAKGIDSSAVWDEVNPNGGVGAGGGHYPHIDSRGKRARWSY